MPAILCDESIVARADRRKIYILVICEDGEATLVQPFHALRDAAGKFRSLIDDDPDFREDEIGDPSPLARTVAKAINSVGGMMLIVERTI